MLLGVQTSFSQLQTSMLVVIDLSVDAPYLLAQGVIDGAEVLFLDPHSDSIPQITTALAEGNYRSLHLVSHGSPGCLHLGDTSWCSHTLSQYKHQLRKWGVAEILIYGCHVASNPDLIFKLNSLTGASSAASELEVGKGYWTLEFQIGEITSGSAFGEQLKQLYQGKFNNTYRIHVELTTIKFEITLGK